MGRHVRPVGTVGNFDDMAAPGGHCSSISMRRPIANGPVTHVTGPLNCNHFVPASSSFTGP